MQKLAQRFIDPKVLSRISNLELIARTVVEGFLAGLHRSPYHGFSLDFAEYRQYSPGDDIRTVDWKVFARSDRFYVKKYEGDTNTQVYLLLDVSRSMDFSSHALSKLEYARYLVASLAYFALRQRDAVGLICFDSKVSGYVPPRASRANFFSILAGLEKVRAGGKTDIPAALAAISHLVRKKALVVLISDFYQEVPKILKSLRFFHHRGNDVILFHLLDPLELELPLGDLSTLEDMETKEFLSYAPQHSRETYLDLLGRHLESLGRESRNSYMDYQLFNTEEPLDRALHQYLFMRAKRW